ncbi:MAG: ABC transporter ATP-binding protein [Actinobacteria bacterium]|nr:MAG: ABC transporter ATP-binding protein [Actinomycetota bacterium]TMM25053.1 MAG: ABC transporter ATP-binding protein [Actinomycetota bacterium]
MSLLQLENVVAGYGFGDVLKGIDLTLERETITCLIGPNGAGKSTVLKTISGLLHPRHGSVRFEGEDIARRRPRAVLDLGIVQVPQERSLFPLMSVWENMLMGAYILNDHREARRRAESLAERFQLVRDRRTERAGSLSGGEQKLVEIARALMLDPKLLLFDEPSAGLAPQARAQVFEVLGSLRGGGWTILLVEQNARSGLSIADCGAVLDAGVVKLEKPATSLLADPEVARLYLGARRDPVGVSTNRPPERPAASTRVTATRKEKPVE